MKQSSNDDVFIVKETPCTSALASQNVASSRSFTQSENLNTIQSLSAQSVGQYSQSSSNAALPSTSDTLPSSPSSVLSDADDMPIPPAFQVIHEKPDEKKDLA